MSFEVNEVQRLGEEPDWWASIRRVPAKILDQDFGYELFEDELVAPYTPGDALVQRKKEVIDQSGFSSVSFGKDFFQVLFSTNFFHGQTLEGNVERGFLVISGEHEERKEGNGITQRKFVRRYMLPAGFDDCDLRDVEMRSTGYSGCDEDREVIYKRMSGVLIKVWKKL